MKKILVLGLLAAIAASAPASAQQAAQGGGQASKAPAYKAPRNSLGQPDFTGAWSNMSLTPSVRSVLYGARAVHTPEEVRILEGAQEEKLAKGNAPSDVNAGAAGGTGNVGAYDQGWIDNGVKVMRVRGEPRTSMLTTEDGQVPPRRGAAKAPLPPNAGSVEAGLQAARLAASRDQFEGQGSAAAARAGSYDNPETRGVGERCLIGFGRNAGPPMFPNGWYNNNYQIVQSRDAVAITVEMVHDTRIVRLNDKHRTDGVRPWFGDSIGWYEGDTLVIETIRLPAKDSIRPAPTFLVPASAVVEERYTRVGKDRLLYQFTVKDPTVWAEPWSGEYEFSPTGGEVYEYACHEGNYALEGILAGARAEERAAAAQRAAAQ